MKLCKDCKDRFIGCHSSCDDYKEYRTTLDIANHNRQLQKEYRGYRSYMLYKQRRPRRV